MKKLIILERSRAMPNGPRSVTASGLRLAIATVRIDIATAITLKKQTLQDSKRTEDMIDFKTKIYS